ncbi:hypothetical protein ACFFK0_13645 [Paenibacillus chartarius]|uniref:Uncharacterized protein n=1 Tax=Paenibacillus chartarius TaxID=747481 RepID=A0ABV6DLJ1_9BACL
MMNLQPAQSGRTASSLDYSQALEHALRLLPIPEGYTLRHARPRKQNGAGVWVFRYEKSSEDNLGWGGEHYSFVVAMDAPAILGFTWMDRRFTAGALPSPEMTREAARDFLNKLEPGLFDRLQNLWIDRHDETIRIHDGLSQAGASLVISGMKYKCYRQEHDDYAWVIVGPDGQVITFEQGILWDNGRVTEKWLHDSWASAFEE